ncbi:MAG: type 4a pilus biogenesis protein PilO [bacterium]
MLNLSAREKKWVIFMVVFISVIVIYRFFLIPFIDQWNSTTRQIQIMETRLKQAKLLKANPLLAVYTQETIQNQTAAVANLLENLESWSVDAGLTMTSVRPGPVQKRGNYTELNYEVDVTGDLTTLCRFIDKIEQPGVIARLNKIRIAKPKDILKDMTASLTISTLSIPEATPTKKTGGVNVNNEL